MEEEPKNKKIMVQSCDITLLLQSKGILLLNKFFCYLNIQDSESTLHFCVFQKDF